VNVHDLRLPFVVSIDFWQYKVEIEVNNVVKIKNPDQQRKLKIHKRLVSDSGDVQKDLLEVVKVDGHGDTEHQHLKHKTTIQHLCSYTPALRA